MAGTSPEISSVITSAANNYNTRLDSSAIIIITILLYYYITITITITILLHSNSECDPNILHKSPRHVSAMRVKACDQNWVRMRAYVRAFDSRCCESVYKKLRFCNLSYSSIRRFIIFSRLSNLSTSVTQSNTFQATNFFRVELRKCPGFLTSQSNVLLMFLWNVLGTFKRNIERSFHRNIQRTFAENVPETFHRNGQRVFLAKVRRTFRRNINLKVEIR